MLATELMGGLLFLLFDIDGERVRPKTPLMRDDIEPARKRVCGKSPAALSDAITASALLGEPELLGSH